MADKKISELTATTTLGDTDVFPIVQGSVTKKISVATFKSNLNLTDVNDLDVNGILTVTGDTNVGILTASGAISAASLAATSSTITTAGSTTSNIGTANMGAMNVSGIQIISSSEDVIDVSKSITLCTNPLVEAYNIDLGIAAAPGHIHFILFKEAGMTLVATNGAGWTSIAPSSPYGTVTLMFADSSWYILTSRLVTIT